MTWQNVFHAALKRLSPFAYRDGGQTLPQTSVGDCHTVPITKMTPLPDDPQRSTLLDQALVQREMLASQWQAARKRRDMVLMHRLESEMRASVASILIRGRYYETRSKG